MLKERSCAAKDNLDSENVSVLLLRWSTWKNGRPRSTSARNAGPWVGVDNVSDRGREDFKDMKLRAHVMRRLNQCCGGGKLKDSRQEC